MSDQRTTNGASRPDEETTLNRRRLLKASGMGIAATSLPITVAGQSKASTTNSVDTSDSDSLKRFAMKVLTADSEEEAEKLWESLNIRQAEAVTNYIDEHSTTEVTVKSDTGLEEVQYNSRTIPVEQVDSIEGTPQTVNDSQVVSDSEQAITPNDTYLNSIAMSANRKFFGVNVYKMTHTVGWWRNSYEVYIGRNTTSGRGRASEWYDIRQTFMNEFNHENFASSYAGREYEHNPPAPICNAYNAKVNIRVNRNGSASLISRDVNYD